MRHAFADGRACFGQSKLLQRVDEPSQHDRRIALPLMLVMSLSVIARMCRRHWFIVAV